MKNISLASAVIGAGIFNAGARRPFLHDTKGPCICVNGKVLQTNAPALLRYDEWKDIDREVITIATQRLVGVSDLISKGLTHPLGSVGNTISLYERSSDITGANINMSGIVAGEKDTVNYDNVTVPVPVVHKDFSVNWRRLEASRKFGESVDTSMAGLASRVVAEASEDMLFAGAAIQVDGASIYGYTTHPDRNTVVLSVQWTNGAKTGAAILADVQAMLAAARADSMFGPFMLYIPAAYEGKLDDDFNPATSDTRTIRQRILALGGIEGIQVADRMPAHNVVLVQMVKQTVDMAIAQDITTIQWDERGGMVSEYKVMAVWVPRIKSDYDGRCGVVHLS